jgi:hypothetical protein
LYYGGTTYENTAGLGMHLSAAGMPEKIASKPQSKKEAGLRRPTENELLAIPITRLYDRGTTVVPAELLHHRIGELSIALHPDAAQQWGVDAGQKVNVSFDGVSGEAVVKVDERVPVGVALIPRSMGLAIHEPVAVHVQGVVEGQVKA